MVTMLKEKVNTHFSFPLLLNMSGYMEKNLIPSLSTSSNSPLSKESIGCHQSSADGSAPSSVNSETTDSQESDELQKNIKYEDESSIYELIGVTVHTGNHLLLFFNFNFFF